MLLPLFHQGEAQAITRFGIILVQPEGLLKMVLSFHPLGLFEQGVAEIAVSLSEVRLDGDRLPEAGLRSSNFPCRATAMPRLLWASKYRGLTLTPA